MKTIVIGAGPVGALAAIYTAQRGHDVEVYELRNGELYLLVLSAPILPQDFIQYISVFPFCLATVIFQESHTIHRQFLYFDPTICHPVDLVS
jgi:hypothetical protein